MRKSFKLSLIAAMVIACSSCATGSKVARYRQIKPAAGISERTLLNVMKEKIKGFNVGVWYSFNAPASGLNGLKTTGPEYSFARKVSYTIYGKEVHLVIDDIDVEQFYEPRRNTIPITLTGDYLTDRNAADMNDRLEFIKTFLTSIKADDIKEIEVMPGSYKSDFDSEYNNGRRAGIITNNFIFVKVTTVSGNSMLMNQQIGAVSRSQK